MVINVMIMIIDDEKVFGFKEVVAETRDSVSLIKLRQSNESCWSFNLLRLQTMKFDWFEILLFKCDLIARLSA